ncbi:response regulator transcription factor [Cellulomonas fimi]|uniref:Two component transcriptional regulator, winged helix family n=1 Tax=Cellulomonas fimi (strain ATCC 484 / DSM 20113 / JCM 1341 / CCUG 24087 / LMG 16345 / NBRC 15513 / NCIMB 8980 / NCTC 7547 / NRS-133) TaxID=590998 RepID=F4H5M0_CELFA|nr:response regulator transcription factor [Cellulomonas fimi]AEE44344.1 two component transcriptional regulator, winged helix family [Cellulomonas fimi ATCC 484]VEH26167.1 Mycobacterial persistence regulator A [Cellulomonas fimi]
MTPGARVLVVDDDLGIRELLTSVLGFSGFDVQTAATVGAGLTALRAWRPDVVVLDVMLPDADGIDMVRVVRRAGDRTPVLFLSARDTVADRVAGLTVGGDDYLTKPFDISEVVARVEAVLRRARTDRVTADAGDDDVLRYRDLRVDTARMTARRGDRDLDLTPTEFRLLAALAGAAERVLSKAQLLDRVWAYDFGGDASVVEKLVSRLRRKVDPDGEVPLVRTVRGFGYTLRADAPDAGARTAAERDGLPGA